MITITPKPWALRGYQIRAENGLGVHVGTYQIKEADGLVMAASPELLEAVVNLISVIEQLIPEPSARGVADVVLAGAHAALAKAGVKP